MWKQIETQRDIDELLLECQGFHDCCLYSMQYTSGAYVDQNGNMHPINSQRAVELQVHQQSAGRKTIELRFEGIETLVLSPTPPNLTCELLEGYVVLHDDKVFWMSDRPEVSDTDQRMYIRAEKMLWRRA